MACAIRSVCVLLMCFVVSMFAGCASEGAADVTSSSPASSSSVRFDFEGDDPGSLPAGLESALTGEGRPGRWAVREGDSALRGRVLAQTDDDATEARYPLCIARAVVAKDVRASVQFRAMEGQVDQAAGLVVRCRDERTYYMARANALEGNVRFYRIVDGVRKQLASARLVVSAQAWHKLVLEARGTNFRVEYDGTTLLSVEDSTLQEAGRAGLWTKADSVTWFDDFSVESFDTQP